MANNKPEWILAAEGRQTDRQRARQASLSALSKQGLLSSVAAAAQKQQEQTPERRDPASVSELFQAVSSPPVEGQDNDEDDDDDDDDDDGELEEFPSLSAAAQHRRSAYPLAADDTETTAAATATTALVAAGAVMKKGYLTKQGAAVKSWRKRLFVLKSDSIAYYKDERVCAYRVFPILSPPPGLLPLEKAHWRDPPVRLHPNRASGTPTRTQLHRGPDCGAAVLCHCRV